MILMLGGQEGEGDQVWFMGSNRLSKMEGTVEQGNRVAEFSFRSKKCQRRQEEKVCTMTKSINQQEERLQFVTGCSGKTY